MAGDPAAIAAPRDRYAVVGCTKVLFDRFPRDSTDGKLEAMERFSAEIRPLARRLDKSPIWGGATANHPWR